MKTTSVKPTMNETSTTSSTAGAGRGRRIGAAALGLLVLVLVLLVQAGRAGTAAGDAEPEDGLTEYSLSVDGNERSYAVFAPEGLPDDADTLLVLHGSGGNVARIRAFTGRRFERLAEAHGFRVIYPRGFEGNWNGCRARAPFSANRLGVDDVAFIEALLRREAGEQGRRFVFGFSGGGHMAFRLALEAPDSIDGIAAVGASLPTPDNTDCDPRPGSEPPAVLLVNGTADPINPHDGGPIVLPAALGGAELGAVRSSQATARFFAARNGHGLMPRDAAGPESDGDPGTGVRISSWEAPGKAAVRLVTILGGGHTIPQPGVTFPPVAGRHTDELDAPLAVVRFLLARLDMAEAPWRNKGPHSGAGDTQGERFIARRRGKGRKDDDGARERVASVPGISSVAKA